MRMKIQYKNKILEIKEGTTIEEALKDEIEHSDYTVVGAIFNNEYTNLGCKIKKDGKVIEKNDYTKTAVYIKKMTEKEIKEYVETKEPLDKAGSYAIQGIGGKFIDKIEGSYNNVVGMDTEKLAKYLNESNFHTSHIPLRNM